jgi:hypothetical protein
MPSIESHLPHIPRKCAGTHSWLPRQRIDVILHLPYETGLPHTPIPHGCFKIT